MVGLPLGHAVTYKLPRDPGDVPAPHEVLYRSLWGAPFRASFSFFSLWYVGAFKTGTQQTPKSWYANTWPHDWLMEAYGEWTEPS